MRFFFEYWGYRIGAVVIRFLPLRFLQAVGARGARLVYRRGGKRVSFVRTNLGIAFPELSEEERGRIGQESFVHFTWNLIDMLRAEVWTAEEIRERVSLDGIEHYDKAMAAGKGVLLLTLHMGNFELGSLSGPLFGVDATFVGRPIRNKYLYERLSRLRTRTGSGLIGKRDIVPSILRELRKGRAVGILNDQYSKRSRGIFVPFFGVRCSTSAGVGMLALRSGAPVLPSYVVRDGPDHNHGTILPPIEFERTGRLKEDLAAVTTAFNRSYEGIIRQHPEQYWWNTRRYRHSPDLPSEPYDW